MFPLIMGVTVIATLVGALVALWKSTHPSEAVGEKPAKWPWLFLLLGLIPPPALLIVVGPDPAPWVIWVVRFCCLVAGYGLFCQSQPFAVRIFLALTVAFGLFIFNVVVALMVGCSGGGRIAP